MKRIVSLLLVFGLLLGISGCGGSDSSKDTKKSEAEEEVMSEDDIHSELFTIGSWIIGDYWNEGLVDLASYTQTGTDAAGAEMDVNLTLENYNKYLATAKEYDAFITSLDKKTYADVIESWNRMYGEMKSLDTFIQQGVTANSSPEWNTDLFVQYRDDFTDKVNTVNGVK